MATPQSAKSGQTDIVDVLGIGLMTADVEASLGDCALEFVARLVRCILAVRIGLLVGFLESTAESILEGLPVCVDLAVLEIVWNGAGCVLPMFGHQVLPILISQVGWAVISWAWFESSCGFRGYQCFSVYRRPGLSQHKQQQWKEDLFNHLSTLGAATWFAGGDWNTEPEDDPLHLWAGSLQAAIHYPTEHDPDAPEHNPDSHQHHLPPSLPTRWNGERCIDWSIQRNQQAIPRLSHRKYADHKLLEYTLHACGCLAWRCGAIRHRGTGVLWRVQRGVPFGRPPQLHHQVCH